MKVNIRGFEAIIMDFDGVIVETDIYNFEVFEKLFKKYKIPFNKEIYETKFMGRTLKEVMYEYLNKYFENKKISELIEEKKDVFDKDYKKRVILYEDSMNLLKRAHGKKRVCVVSGTRRKLLEIASEKFGLEKYVEFFITSEDYQKGKPHPHPYLKAIEKLNATITKIVAVEDSLSGINSAKNANLKCIAVTNTNPRKNLLAADYVVESLNDIIL